MAHYQALFMEYDDIIIGKRRNFSDRFFGDAKKVCMRSAIIVMRYAFTTYLQWTPEAVLHNLNRKIMECMHLLSLMKYIDYPIEYDKETDFFYVASLVYKSKRLGIRDKTIHTYEMVIHGDLSKYPKEYFTGNDGIVRAGICLQYMINHFVPFEDINDLYYIFATEQGYSLLKEYKLLNACRESFDTPVDFLHFVLDIEQKSSFYLHYYKFKFYKEMMRSNGRKRRNEKNYKLEGGILK